jgi:hypothetical protein
MNAENGEELPKRTHKKDVCLTLRTHVGQYLAIQPLNHVTNLFWRRRNPRWITVNHPVKIRGIKIACACDHSARLIGEQSKNKAVLNKELAQGFVCHARGNG